MLPRLNKSAVMQYAENEAGERELRLFHLDKEICSVEPELFTFGETGWQLSHGERSRVFLARALLQRAQTLVVIAHP